MNTDQILLYSGGMDSFIAWYYLGQPIPLFVRMGHLYQLKEFEAVMATLPSPPTVFSKKWPIGDFEKSDANIPGRNALLAFVAAEYGAKLIYIVAQKDEMNIPDKSERFYRDTSVYLSFLFEREITVDTPFRAMDKTDMVAWYCANVGDTEKLLKTVGCYNKSDFGSHCGNCKSCFRRYVALMNNGVDPGYSLSDGIKAYYRERFQTYSVERQQRMQRYVGEG